MCHRRCLRRPSLFSTFVSMFLTNKSHQAKHAETDPRHGTPPLAHFQPPESCGASVTSAARPILGRFAAARRSSMSCPATCKHDYLFDYMSFCFISCYFSWFPFYNVFCLLNFLRHLDINLETRSPQSSLQALLCSQRRPDAVGMRPARRKRGRPGGGESGRASP